MDHLAALEGGCESCYPSTLIFVEIRYFMQDGIQFKEM